MKRILKIGIAILIVWMLLKIAKWLFCGIIPMVIACIGVVFIGPVIYIMSVLMLIWFIWWIVGIFF